MPVQGQVEDGIPAAIGHIQHLRAATWPPAGTPWRGWSGARAPLFFYRDKDRKEIDLLIQQDQTLYPIEIKKTSQPAKSAVSSFSVLGNLGPGGCGIGPGALVCLAAMRLPLTAEVTTVPVGLL